MALSFADQGTLAVDRAFIAKVRQAGIAIAIGKVAPDANLSEEQLGARTGFSVTYLRAPQYWAEIMAYGVVSKMNDMDATDARITTALNTIWDKYCGVVA